MNALSEVLVETRGRVEMAIRHIGAADRVAALVALRDALRGIDEAAERAQCGQTDESRVPKIGTRSG